MVISAAKNGLSRSRLPDEKYRCIASSLCELSEYGEKRGVRIVIEPMSHFRTHVANRPAQIAELINLADHGNLRALLDTYHMVTEVRDYGAAIRELGDRLWGMHMCESDRGVPGGGLVPWDEVFAALRDVEFDGYLIFETYNSSVGDFAASRGMFHDVCPDGEKFLKQGIEFVQRYLRGSSARG